MTVVVGARSSRREYTTSQGGELRERARGFWSPEPRRNKGVVNEAYLHSISVITRWLTLPPPPISLFLAGLFTTLLRREMLFLFFFLWEYIVGSEKVFNIAIFICQLADTF